MYLKVEHVDGEMLMWSRVDIDAMFIEFVNELLRGQDTKMCCNISINLGDQDFEEMLVRMKNEWYVLSIRKMVEKRHGCYRHMLSMAYTITFLCIRDLNCGRGRR